MTRKRAPDLRYIICMFAVGKFVGYSMVILELPGQPPASGIHACAEKVEAFLSETMPPCLIDLAMAPHLVR
jgi:hypothetical protein